MLTLIALIVAFVLGGLYAGRLVVLLHGWYQAARAKVRGWLHLTPIILLACATPFAPHRAEAQAAHPNEPAGYRPSRFLDGTRIPTGTATAAGYPLGQWYGAAIGSVSLVGGAYQTRFPAGLAAGVAPANFGGYDAQRRELSGIYLSEWIQIVGPTFENHPAGTKVGFLAVGRPVSGGENETFLFLTNPAGVQTFQSAFPMEIRQQGIPQPNGSVTRNLGQNVDRRALMTAGGWHHWEVALTLNTLGQADGTARMWIDGVLVLSYSNVVFRTAAYPRGFTLYKWNPTWGGKAGFTKRRTNYIQVRDLYLSGTP